MHSYSNHIDGDSVDSVDSPPPTETKPPQATASDVLQAMQSIHPRPDLLAHVWLCCQHIDSGSVKFGGHVPFHAVSVPEAGVADVVSDWPEIVEQGVDTWEELLAYLSDSEVYANPAAVRYLLDKSKQQYAAMRHEPWIVAYVDGMTRSMAAAIHADDDVT